MSELKSWEKEFIERFTFIDKGGNSRMNNNSPKKVKGFIKATLKQQSTEVIEELEKIANSIGTKYPYQMIDDLISKLKGEG